MILGPIKHRLAPVLGLALTLAGASSAPAADIAERVQLCAGCHGEDGNSRTPLIPSLAGQPDFFLMNQLVLIREGVRKIPQMEGFAKQLKDDEIAALAAHFSALPVKKTDEPTDSGLAAEGARIAASHHCASCHKEDLSGQEQMPRIAGQRLDYLTETLKSLRDSQRSGADPLMVEAVYGLTDRELAALAHYAASK
jgi:cytochrome c553